MSSVDVPDEVALQLIKSSIWRTPGVSDQPETAIIRWRVLQAEEGGHHVVGFNLNDAEGRVSTAIVGFDAGARTVSTASGRVYKLVGPSAYDSDGDWVWGAWARKNKVSTVEDVSACYEREMDASGSAS